MKIICQVLLKMLIHSTEAVLTDLTKEDEKKKERKRVHAVYLGGKLYRGNLSHSMTENYSPTLGRSNK